jgi:predicted metal-dependent hydrolase
VALIPRTLDPDDETVRRFIERGMARLGAPEPPSAPRTPAELDELIAMWAVRLDVKVGRVQLRDMRSKWASYSSRGTLTLHRDLLRLPRDLVDYVLCHELLHGKVPNHSLGWELLMGMHIPDWRERQLRLAAWMLREGDDGSR